jgi:hypothetical protein
MNAIKRKPEWWFYPAWVLVTGISVFITGVMYWVIISIIEKFVGGTIFVAGQSRTTEDYLFPFIVTPTIGLIIGSFQFLLLRRYFYRISWWIAATWIGWMLPFVAGYYLNIYFVDTILDNTLWMITFGLFIGVCQWLVIRRQLDYGALWIAANLIGWGFLVPIVGNTRTGFLDFGVFMLIPGVLTSIAWWMLLDKLQQTDQSSSMAASI